MNDEITSQCYWRHALLESSAAGECGSIAMKKNTSLAVQVSVHFEMRKS